MAEFVNGDDSILSILRSGSYKPIACLTSNGTSESLTFNEVQTKCDPGVIQSTPNAYSYTKSLEGILTDTTSVGGDTALASWDYLKGLMRAKTLILWKEEIGNPAFISEYGEGYLENLELTSPAGENITFTGSIKGTGSITNTAP
jgi:hypothetical protein